MIVQGRLIVEGYISGQHKSPYHGFSVEFAEHREYSPGDDLKHLDWKVYSRTGRFYLKQYEEETNLTCWLLVDASESMLYGSGPITKYDYACMAAAALAYLIAHDSALREKIIKAQRECRLKFLPDEVMPQFQQIVNKLVVGTAAR